MVRTYEYNDRPMSLLNPFVRANRVSELHSLLCVRADSTEGTDFDGVDDASFFARANEFAGKGQTVLKGGSTLLSLPQIEHASVRGPEDDAKLQPGALVSISLDLHGSSFPLILDYNPNPMQAIATVEFVRQDTVDVRVPGVCMQDLNEKIRVTEQGEGWYRANVDRELVAAHMTFRNFYLRTDLADNSDRAAGEGRGRPSADRRGRPPARTRTSRPIP